MTRNIYPKLPRSEGARRRGQEENGQYHDNGYQGTNHHDSYPEQITYRVNKQENVPNYHRGPRQGTEQPENRMTVYQQPGYDPVDVSKVFGKTVLIMLCVQFYNLFLAYLY